MKESATALTPDDQETSNLLSQPNEKPTSRTFWQELLIKWRRTGDGRIFALIFLPLSLLCLLTGIILPAFNLAPEFFAGVGVFGWNAANSFLYLGIIFASTIFVIHLIHTLVQKMRLGRALERRDYLRYGDGIFIIIAAGFLLTRYSGLFSEFFAGAAGDSFLIVGALVGTIFVGRMVIMIIYEFLHDDPETRKAWGQDDASERYKDDFACMSPEQQAREEANSFYVAPDETPPQDTENERYFDVRDGRTDAQRIAMLNAKEKDSNVEWVESDSNNPDAPYIKAEKDDPGARYFKKGDLASEARAQVRWEQRHAQSAVKSGETLAASWRGDRGVAGIPHPHNPPATTSTSSGVVDMDWL